jgi:Ca2+-binding EF-hand superfamily protein
LLKKLSQKSGGSMSDEAVLMKCFKYFDLNNNGTVEAEEFAKAIEKIGIMIPTRQVSNQPIQFPIPHPGAATHLV